MPSAIGSSHQEKMAERAAESPAYRAELERLAPYEQVARLVIAERGKMGWSQEKLAEEMGAPLLIVKRIESGQRPIGLKTLDRVAQAFDKQLVIDFA